MTADLSPFTPQLNCFDLVVRLKKKKKISNERQNIKRLTLQIIIWLVLLLLLLYPVWSSTLAEEEKKKQKTPWMCFLMQGSVYRAPALTSAHSLEPFHAAD